MKSLLLFIILFVFGTISNINAQVNGPINICQGTTYNYQTAFSTAYSWSVTGGSATIATPSAQTTDITFNDPIATYTVTAVTTSPNATFTVIVTNDTPPAPTANGSTICEGNTALPTTNGVGTLSWFNTPTGGTSFFTGGMYNTPALFTTTTYYIEDVLGGCPSLTRTPVTITVNPIPVVNISGLNTICSGQGVSLVANVTSGGPIATHFWNPGSFTTSSITPTPISTTNYTLTVTNSFSCSNTFTHSVTVNAIPSVTVNSPSICAGQAIGLTAAGATTYSWMPPTGLSSTTGSGVTASPASTTIYTVTGTSAGCSGTATSAVTVNPLPIVTANSATICFGGNATLIASGATTYTWSPGGQLTSSISVSPIVTTTYTVMGASVAGCFNTANTTVVVNPLPSASATLDTTVCQNTPLSLIGTGVGYVSSNWSLIGGAVVSSIDTFTYNPSTNEQYIYTVTNISGCSADDTVTVSVNPSTNISGTASSTFGVFTADAYLLRYNAIQLAFDTIQTTALGSNQYTFYGITAGSYLLKIFADTGSFPLLVPTYYGDEFQWDSAVVINHGCLVDFTADINMIELPVNSGTGFISGHLIEDPGFGLRLSNLHNHIMAPGGPLKGIDVKLGKNPGGGIQARTMSDTTGYYEFTNIPTDTFTIYIDIPGLPMDSSYHVTISAGAETFTGLDYFADSNSVYPLFVAVGLPRANEIENSMNVFPNPVKQNLHIRFSSFDASAKIELCNAQGITLYEQELKGLAKGEQELQLNLDKMKISNGVYFLRISTNNTITTKKIIVTE